MNRRADFSLELKIYSNQNLPKPDICDLRWAEELTGLKHVGSVAGPLAAATTYFPVYYFVQVPKIVVVKVSQDCTIRLLSSGLVDLSGPLPITVLDSGRGVLAVSCQSAEVIRVDGTPPGEVTILGLGDI